MVLDYKDNENPFQGNTNSNNINFLTHDENKRDNVLNSKSDLTNQTHEANTPNNLFQSQSKQKISNANNDPMLNYINSNRVITDEEINASPLLLLSGEQSNIFNGKELTINAGGLVGGRNRKDGVTLFGFAGISSSSPSSTVNTDYELSFPPSKVNKDFPYVFAIHYQKDQKTYFIRAYATKGSYNSILFIKLYYNNTLPLKQKEILSIGNTLFQINPNSSSNNTTSSAIEIVNLNKKETYTYTKEDLQEITIGRDINCTIPFTKDKSLSKIQTTINYDESSNTWVIRDGSNSKSSSNGTWVFGFHSFPIKDQMIVEVLDMKIKFSLKLNVNLKQV